MIRGKERLDTKFERAKMVAQLKKLDTGKLLHHEREFQVEIQNRFAGLPSIPPDDFDSRGDATAKTIHGAAISVTGRYKSEKPDKLLRYQTTDKEAQENEEQWHTNRKH